MIDKLLASRSTRRVLALLMAAGLLLGTLSLVYPASRRNQALQQLGDTAVAGSSSLSTAITELAGDDLQSLLNMPLESPSFRQLSGLLTKVAVDNRYNRIYMVYRDTGGYYTLLDSAYRDNGRAGVDYYAPGEKYAGPVAQKLKGELDRTFRGKGKDSYLPNFVLNERQERIAVSHVLVRDTRGEVQAVLICEVPAGNADFTQLGPIDLTALAVLSYSVFAVALALLVAMNKWRKARYTKARAKAAEQAVAEAECRDIDAPELPAAQADSAPDDQTPPTDTPAESE